MEPRCSSSVASLMSRSILSLTLGDLRILPLAEDREPFDLQGGGVARPSDCAELIFRRAEARREGLARLAGRDLVRRELLLARYALSRRRMKGSKKRTRR